MPLTYILLRVWQWIIDPGLMLGLLIVLAFMVPRVGRFAFRVIDRRISKAADQGDSSSDEGKAQLALTSVAVYLGQLVAYFLLFVFALQELGFSLAGATVPATVASAAIGLGAQSIIADFLAGFFILSEKQYGIGDWVRFEGTGIKVEGTVIQITMRATRIRTLAEETVTIPNSAAKVCINSSNYWSRAVVTIAVPLLGSRSAHEAIERSTAAAGRAISQPQIADDILDELDVQPAVGITPPTTVGMPWMIEMRFLAKVTAGSQWRVERAIRTEVLDEFWEEYGSASTVTGELRNTLSEIDGNISFSDLLSDAPAPLPHPTNYGTDPQLDTAEQARTQPAVAEPEPRTEVAPEPKPESRWRRLLSLGGRVRASTTALAVAIALLIFLWASTLRPGDDWQGGSGWLAPNLPQPVATTPAFTPDPQPSSTEEPGQPLFSSEPRPTATSSSPPSTTTSAPVTSSEPTPTSSAAAPTSTAPAMTPALG